MTAFSDRLRAVIGDTSTPHGWAQANELRPQKVWDWLKNGRTPQRAQLVELADKTGIALDWWLHGNLPPPAPTKQREGLQRPLGTLTAQPAYGEKETPQGGPSIIDERKPGPIETLSELAQDEAGYEEWAESVQMAADFAPVRYFRNARVSAGHGAENHDEEPEALLFSKKFLRTIGVRPANLYLVRVRGDSMLPTLQSGWTVMINTMRRTVTSGIYVVRLNGEELCKRLEARPGGTIKVISDNALYPEYEITGANQGDFAVLGKVVWFAGLVQ